MKNALVTGGCGFLGSWIVRALLEEGVSVRVLALPGESSENLEGLDVERVEGDVRNRADVEAAVSGVDTVFHAAAVYDGFAPDPTRMYDVNLRGTFFVMEAARRAGVERVVYTASVVSIGRPKPGETADEGTPYECWDIDFAYSRSKLFSRELAEYFAAWDLDVRVVLPAVVLGPGDLRPTPSGELIIKSFELGPAIYFDGGMSYVDVRDVARVHVLAAQKGSPGERYLASGTNLTHREFAEAIQRQAGTNRRAIRLPTGLARATGRLMDRRARATGSPPLLPLDFFEYGLQPGYYENEKARSELGATFRPIDQTIRDAIEYFRGRGLIPR